MEADISKPLLAVAARFLAFLGAAAAAALLTCSTGSCCFTVTPWPSRCLYTWLGAFTGRPCTMQHADKLMAQNSGLQ